MFADDNLQLCFLSVNITRFRHRRNRNGS